jgi:phosphoribosylamine--glycine ligase
MGAYCPTPLVDDRLMRWVEEHILVPTVHTMKRGRQPFRGVLYAGLMITADGPKLIEYNVRFGDPETQVLMPRLDGDLLEILLAAAEGRLADVSPRWSEDAALTIVMAAEGYPGPCAKSTPISGLDAAAAVHGATVFQAGTALRDGTVVSNGGRVLNVTARGNSIAQAQERAYEAAARIVWPGGFYRRDIGWRALGRPLAG